MDALENLSKHIEVAIAPVPWAGIVAGDKDIAKLVKQWVIDPQFDKFIALRFTGPAALKLTPQRAQKTANALSKLLTKHDVNFRAVQCGISSKGINIIRILVSNGFAQSKFGALEVYRKLGGGE